MGSADFFKSGEWNGYCQLCGRKEKSGRMERTWDGFYVCTRHKEVRNPQDRLRGVREDFKLPWYSPKIPSGGYVCALFAKVAVPNLAVAGCVIPGVSDAYSTLPPPITKC